MLGNGGGRPRRPCLGARPRSTLMFRKSSRSDLNVWSGVCEGIKLHRLEGEGQAWIYIGCTDLKVVEVFVLNWKCTCSAEALARIRPL